MKPETHVLEVKGEFACFSRPELKVERMTYACPTPSAARGIFDAIYLKPPLFRWQVLKVEILSPPAYIALRRNEVKEKVSVRSVGQWMAGKADPEPLWADGTKALTGSDEKGRTQRQTIALKNVHYRLHAQICPWPGKEDRQSSFDSQFRRRAEKGKCFFQPYFGCREFPAFFRLVPTGEQSNPAPIELDRDLGLMLYDVFDLSRPGGNTDRPAISVFRANIQGGVLDIPVYASDEVFRIGDCLTEGTSSHA